MRNRPVRTITGIWPRRIAAFVLMLSLMLPTAVFATTSPTTATVRVTASTVWEVFIQDTFQYPEAFVYNVGKEADTIPGLVYDNSQYNLMLVLAASSLQFGTSYSRTGDSFLTITPAYYDTQAQRQEVRDYVNRTADSLFHAGMTDRERLEAVNRHLVEQFAYDESLTVYSVYPFIRYGTGVCQSYAQLGVMLLLAGGMNAYPVAGNADGASHAWISVEVDGSWYEFDPTYNDNLGYQDASTRVAYLMRTREEMRREGRTYLSTAPYTYLWEDGLRQGLAPSTPTPGPTPSASTEAAPSANPAGTTTAGSPSTGSANTGLIYSDIQPGQWYYEAALAVHEAGLMIGADGRFMPAGTVTLAQTVTVAARVHASRNGYEDVLLEQVSAATAQKKPWYQGYAEYAMAFGLFHGNEFGDKWQLRSARREEMAYLLQKAVGSLPSKTSLFIPDIAEVNPLFVHSVRIMANAGIIQGVDALNTFRPEGVATRAQLAVMLLRLQN